jgi:hypothetical protein
MQQYAELDAQVREITAKRDGIKIKILSAMQEQGLAKVEAEVGKFTVARRTNWKYSAKVAALADKVKVAQIKEQQQGIATQEVTEYLLFTGA